MREKKFQPHYKQGPQGNMIADWTRDYESMYGSEPGEIHSTMPDRRDNRDPDTVGCEILAERKAARAAVTNGHAPADG